MPWKEVGVKDQRISLVARALGGKETMKDLCQEYGISRPTGYLWVKRFQEAGSFQALEEKSRRPHRSPNRTAEKLEQKVVQARKQHGWGAPKLKVILGQRVDLSESTIHRILKRKGLVEKKVGQEAALGQFERSKPNQLWQMDFKGKYVGEQDCHPLSILDDCSRFSLGVFALSATSYEQVSTSLQQVFSTYGVPEAMLMDHGVPWWGTATASGMTRLSVDLMEQGIRLCFSGYCHPQTQGKVERFHSTLAQAVSHRGGPRKKLASWQKLFDEIREEYNHVRPHEALEMGVPARSYQASQQPYNPKPAPWTYPDRMHPVQVRSNGTISWARRVHFVSMSLVGRVVGMEVLNNKLLICYRDTYIREIDLRSAQGKALI